MIIPHRWNADGRCAVCWMAKDWPGARATCQRYLVTHAPHVSARKVRRAKQAERERRKP